jgi:hypothetical protein
MTRLVAILWAALGPTDLTAAQLEMLRAPELDTILADFSHVLAEYDMVLQASPEQLADLPANLEFGALLADVSGVLQMTPVLVGGTKLPVFKESLENRVQELLRTGTLAERVGRRFTSKIWMKGDKGVMLSISW